NSKLLAQAPNDLCREDWVKLAASLQVAYGDELQDDFIAFSQRYVGNACDYNTAMKLWKSTEKPTQVTSIAPALSLLKIAVGDDSFKAIWRDVLSRRDNDLGDNKKSDASGTNQATPPANANEWPEPDLNIGKPQRPAAPTLSEEDFNHIYGPWAQWLRDAAEVKNAPVDYVALSLLGAAGAAIGNSRWGCPWEGWSEPPILWTMLVGDPSAGKSPAMDAVLDAIKDIEQELAETYKREHSEWVDEKEIAELVLSKWKADAKEAVKDGGEVPDKPADAQISAEPLRERIRISDITTEKVADLLSSTWRGLLLARDELSGWISGMDRYTSGGDRPFWLEAYGGRSYTVDRKNSPDPIVVDHLSVAITGGTQPDKLAELLLNTGDDGLLSRFVVVFPDPVGLKRPVSLLDQHKLVEALKRLRSLPAAITEAGDHRPFYVHFSEDAADILQAFRKQCREWETDASGLFKSHIGKMPGLVVRVANILAHLDWAADQEEAFPGGISADHVGRACDLVGEYLRLHAYRAYGTAKLPPEVSGAVDIAKIIRSEGLKSFKARDIYNRRRTGLSTLKQVSPALDVLIDADWLRVDTKKTGGRPSQTYIVNPKLEVRHG
ncbi:MAG: YfjI family protein, partial [Pseudomonadota bacterium]